MLEEGIDSLSVPIGEEQFSGLPNMVEFYHKASKKNKVQCSEKL